ncbi:MAG: type I restriction enzyme HsdR N-terminal domain-containing protein [Nitrospirota bacterium]
MTNQSKEEHEKLVRQKIEEENQVEAERLVGAKQIVLEVLVQKGYRIEEIELNPEYRIQLSDCEATVGIDFVINLPEGNFMVIKCSSSAIESWERYAAAFARIAKDYQIPFAMVTDGESARLIDVLKGTVVGRSLDELHARPQAAEKMKNFQKIPCPENRREREKRIVYAFEGIKCPPVKGD